MTNAAEVQQPQNMAQLMTAAVPQRETRIMNYFNVPEGSAYGGVKSIGMVELTTAEEMLATQRSGNDMLRLGTELAKEALREVDGQPINTGDLSADRFWKDVKAPMRMLILAAYGIIHNPPAREDQVNFLLSRRQVAR